MATGPDSLTVKFTSRSAKRTSIPATVNEEVAAAATFFMPRPGEICPCCLRTMPDTPLEVWLAQQGIGFLDLAQQVTAHPIVAAWFEKKPRNCSRRIAKNMVWRLNHQAPWWRGPGPNSVSYPVLAAILEITGLERVDLQNLKPYTDGYACDARETEAARKRREKAGR